MSAGDVWLIPGGHRALELSHSTRDVLVLSIMDPHWPFPKPPVSVPRDLCVKQPSRYHGRVMPEGEEAPF